MIHSNVELHNIAEARSIPEREGVRLQRVPEDVRLKLNPGAQNRMLSPANAEIRFVSEGHDVRITLSSEDATSMVVFYGAFQSNERYTITRETTTIELTRPDRLRLLPPDFSEEMPFSHHVCRLMFAGGPLYFHGIEGDGIRPPEPEEVPKLRYLAYGTSITHGACASGPHLTYVAQAARRLGADLINLGVGGSAHCEFELSDYIAAREDWHIASLALSVNMIGAKFALDEFYERVSYMVNTVAGANTERPVACITIYPHQRDFGDQFHAPDQKGTPEEYRQKLREAVAACPHPDAHLIEGTDILTDIGGLSADLIHPADNGMINMGENLAAKLRPLVARCVSSGSCACGKP